MKKTRLLTSILGLAAIVFGFVLFNGCGKHAASAPEGFKAPPRASAEPTSFNDVAAYLDSGGSLYLYLSTEQWLNGLSGKLEQWKGLFTDMPLDSTERENLDKVFNIVTKIVRDSGVEDISGFGMSSLAVEKNFYRTKSVLHHYKGKGAGFGWTMFGKSAHALDGLDLAPATTAMLVFSDFDLAQLWSVILDETKHSGFPEAQQELSQLPEEFKQATGLDLDKVLASFGGEYGVILTLDESKMVTLPLPTAQPLEIPEPGLLIVAKVGDDLIFKRLEQLLVQMQVPVIRVDKDNLKMRTVQIPMELPFAVRPTIAMANGYLFFASSDTLIEEVLAVKAGTKPGLKSTDEFKLLAKDMPTQGNCYAFVAQRAGQTIMKVQQQAMGLHGSQEPGVAKLMEQFINANTMEHAFAVSAVTDEGYVSVKNGTQNGANAVLLVPVAMVGMMAAIATPNFVKARGTAQKNACINNLRQIDGAKQQWALENRKQAADIPKETDIAPFMYKSSMPTCPQGGEYTIGAVGMTPRCSIPGHSLDY